MKSPTLCFKISKSYKYSNCEQQLIKDWLQGEVKGSDWNSKCFEALKKNIKTFYIKEQNYRCSYCLQKFQTDRHDLWDLEHIIPRKEKPKFMFETENLCVVCKDCNSNKRDYNPLLNKKVKNLPKSAEKYKLVHSHFDEYSEHIKCVSPGKLYLPRNDKGEESIYIYRLNRFYKYQDSRIEEHEEDINDLACLLLQSGDPYERQQAKNELILKVLRKG